MEDRSAETMMIRQSRTTNPKPSPITFELLASVSGNVIGIIMLAIPVFKTREFFANIHVVLW